MKKLEDKVSVITGAGSGMGRVIALLFASEGSKVVATDLNQATLETLKEEITAKGGEVTILVSNIALEEDVNKMIQTAVDNYGTLDILVNNAGVMDNFEPVGDVDNKTGQRVMDVNVTGPFMAIRKAINIMLEKGSGSIVNIASIGGVQGARAGAAYTTSKHALVGLTKNTGFIYAKSGIRCNAIAPGAVNTNIASTIDFSKITQIINERVMPGMALNPRAGEPVEIAKVALFLASDDSSFVNGTVLVVDGGWTAY